MQNRIVQTNKRLAAVRQIHAAIGHYRAGEFECAITLCSAADGQMPEPDSPTLFSILRQADAEHPAPDGQRTDFNYVATWMKHVNGPEDIEFPEWMVLMWLSRAISKYRAVYGIGTPEMTSLFPWASQIEGTVERRS